MSENQTPKSAGTEAAQSPQQLPALRSYLMRRSKAQFAPSRVKLEADQLLPKLSHSQPGIGFYGRVRERAVSRSVELWSQHQHAVEPPSLVLGPCTELTGSYSQTPAQGKQVVAASTCGQYPFSRIVYSNLIGRGDEPIGAGETYQSLRRAQRSQGAFMLRHKMRQTTNCLSRILDSTSTNDAVVRRTMSQIK